MNTGLDQETRNTALERLKEKKKDFKERIKDQKEELDQLRNDLYPKDNETGERKPVNQALNVFEVHQNSSSEDGSMIDDDQNRNQRDIKGQDHFALLSRAQMQALLVDASVS